jgi:hypothetical protein
MNFCFSLLLIKCLGILITKIENELKVIIFVGGFNEKSLDECFHLENGNWKLKSNLLTSRRFSTSFTIDNSSVYVIGGEETKKVVCSTILISTISFDLFRQFKHQGPNYVRLLPSRSTIHLFTSVFFNLGSAKIFLGSAKYLNILLFI